MESDDVTWKQRIGNYMTASAIRKNKWSDDGSDNSDDVSKLQT